MKVDETRIGALETQAAELKTEVDRYLSVANNSISVANSVANDVVTLVSVFLGVLTVAISIGAFVWGRMVHKDAQALLGEYDKKFKHILDTADSDLARTEQNRTKSEGHVKEIQARIEAVEKLWRETQEQADKFRDWARKTLFDSHSLNRPVQTTNPEGGERAADILAKFAGRTPFERHLDRGLVEQEKGDLDTALDAFRQAEAVARDAPSRAKVLYSIASAHATSGSESEVLAALNAIVSLQNELRSDRDSLLFLARAQLGRAHILRKQGDVLAAIAPYTWVVDRLADATEPALRLAFVRALVGRGTVFSEKHDFDRADEDFDHVLRLAPGSTERDLRRQKVLAQYKKARVRFAKGEWSSAADAFDAVIMLLDRAPDLNLLTVKKKALLARADALEHLCDTGGAKECRDRAAGLSDHHDDPNA